jgi:uncharacterized repeat protein (TIGR03806 family)
MKIRFFPGGLGMQVALCACLAGCGGSGSSGAPVTQTAASSVTLRVADASQVEADTGTTRVMSFPVELSEAADTSVSVSYSFEDDSATAGSDYSADAGVVSIAAGDRTASIDVDVLGDTVVEGSERFAIVLSDPVGVTLEKTRAIGTIQDDEAAAGLTVADASADEGDGSTLLDFPVVLAPAATEPVSVSFATQPGTAASDADYAPVSGTLSFAVGENRKVIQVAVLGDSTDEDAEAFQMVLSDPVGAELADGSATGVINDNDEAPTVAVVDVTVDEGAGEASIQLNLSAESGRVVSVSYATTDGSAAAGSDYEATRGTVTFAPGETAAAIRVPVTNDSVSEGDESFSVSLTTASNATLVATAATVTIAEDPVSGAITIADVDVSEGNVGSKSVQVSVALSAAQNSPVTVDYQTIDATASAGDDYQARNGTVTFAPGETLASIAVPVLGDTDDEDDERFQLRLSNPVGADLADSSAVVIIRDNDVPRLAPGGVAPSFAATNATVVEGDAPGSTKAKVVVMLSSASTDTKAVDYQTANGSAIAGPDYVVRTGTLTYPAGTTSASFTVPIVGDRTQEGTESFNVNLSNPVGATIAAPSATVTVLDNDEDVSAPAPAPTSSRFSVADASVTEGDSAGATQATVSVTLAPASAAAASVRYATANQSATAGPDYVSRQGTLNFAAGVTVQNLTVPITGDRVSEATEQFRVVLSDASGATIADGDAQITINDNDGAAPSPGAPPPSAVGLDSRPSNTSCLAPTRTTSSGATSLADAFPSLSNIGGPMKMVQPPNDSSAWYALTRNGKIMRFDNRANATATETYLELPVTARGEGGLLSAQFHPNWPTTREIFVSYTIDSGGFKSRLSRLTINNDSSLPASYSEQVLLTVDQPADNHNGGDLAFGPDGYLYYGLGDGGDQFDPDNLSQNTTRLLGSILRIDVVGVPSGYGIPGNNPFAGNSKCGAGSNVRSCPEIYAWGFRNPWRMSFDGATLWAADVGQNRQEEINKVIRGGNYGWSCKEGSLTGFNTAGCPSDLIDPVYEYAHSDGNGGSVTGGFVYRNSDVPSLNGRYLFGDFLSGKIWKLEGSGSNYRAEQVATLANVSTFAQGNDGKVYALSITNGDVYGFLSSGGVTRDNVADLLTQTGCVDPANPARAEDGMVPYELAAPFWSDAAVKERWIGLPNGTTIDIQANDDWSFPRGTVLMKHFRRDGRLLETRLMMRHPDGDWAGYTYEWNNAQTQANRIRSGKTRSSGATPWIYPSEAECMICHTSAAGFALGPETAQLNSDHRYAATGVTDNQLEVFNHIGMFSVDADEPVERNPALVDPLDTSASLDDRARAYLHSNCAQCHQPGGGTGSTMDLRYNVSLRDTQTCDVAPQSGSLGIGGARIVDPGSDATSVLAARMATRDANAMPPLGSNRVDGNGVSLIRSWINSLSSSCD